MTREQKLAKIEAAVKTGEKHDQKYMVANADARFLLSELQTLQEAMKGATIIANQSGMEIKQLRKERDKLIEGLKWYADEDNYENVDQYGDRVESNVRKDDGDKAREILKELGVTV